jgi:dUTP pyrophosphatase
LEVKIINRSSHPLPAYKTDQAAGLDLMANLEEDCVLQPLERHLISTGLFIELPEGTEAQVRPRSGLALNHGLSILNSPGTIDADYRGEIKVLLVNLSNQEAIVKNGERIAQLVIANYIKINWSETDQLTESNRGEGGYGHTGK